MPRAARLAGICTGHGCWTPRPNDEASPNVFVNSRGQHRQGDHWQVHCCPQIPECHDSVLAAGSPSVYVNGRGSSRGPVACGSAVATGSESLFIGW